MSRARKPRSTAAKAAARAKPAKAGRRAVPKRAQKNIEKAAKVLFGKER